MLSIQPIVAILAAGALVLTMLAAVLGARLRGGRAFDGRLWPRNLSDPSVARRSESFPPSRLAKGTPGNLRVRDSRDPTGERTRRSSEEQLDDVLHGIYESEIYDRVVRTVAWTFILVVLLIVSISGAWSTNQSQIIVTLALGGLFVLAGHEVPAPRRLGATRILLEGSAAIVFLTMLVLLTGYSASPFFFLYALFVGGTALVAATSATLVLTVETVAACALVIVSGPLDSDGLRDIAIRTAINLAAVVLLAYAGIVVAGMQRRTKDAAIRLSTLDSLTDLRNRAYMFNAVEREIERARRYGRAFCLLMMDLDGLKAINDRFGHYEGDLVLRMVAEAIRSSLRTIDIAARYGGDEFVALLPETDPAGAYAAAEKIRQVVSQIATEDEGQRINASVSIGVVTYPEDGETADALMIAADEAMYHSKRLGKNRVVAYTDAEQTIPPLVSVRPVPGTPGLPPLGRRVVEQQDMGGRPALRH